MFAGLFAITWWSWVTTTLYANRFDTNDVLYRVLKLAATFAVAVMAASATTAIGGSGTVAFGIGYIATRVILAGLYFRAWRHIADVRVTIDLYLAATVISAIIWTISLFMPTPVTYILWAVGIAVEAAAPFAATRWGQNVPLHLDHLPERFGLFVILVLGSLFRPSCSECTTRRGRGRRSRWRRWGSPSRLQCGGCTSTSPVPKRNSRFRTTTRRWAAAAPTAISTGTFPHSGDRPARCRDPAVRSASRRRTHRRRPLDPLRRVALFVVGISSILGWSSGDWKTVVPWPGLAIPVVLVLGAVDNALPFASAIVLALGAILAVVTGIIRRQRSAVETSET